MLLASVALVAVGASAAPAVAAREQRYEPGDDPAAINLRLLDIPAARAEDPRARVYIIDHLKPGATISRRVEVRNDSPATQKIELYAGAASVENDGFTVPDDRTGNDLSGWIRLKTAAIELAPGERDSVAVEIAVPKKASRGERYAAIWAQVTSGSKQSGNVVQVHRVGIRVYLDVGPGGEPPTDFRIGDLAAERGIGEFPVVTANVTNTGERALDMTGRLTMSKGAVQAGPFKVTNGLTILPGQSGKVRIEVNQALPAGVWDVQVLLASGLVERKAEGRITLPVAAPMAVEESPRGVWLAYATGIAALLVLVVLVGWYLARRQPTRLTPGRRLG
ncbi:DUF916 domain-containing protein [Micromonospora lupini]|uniref:hypothetical protein n=1 Tax=Micromonospora lupini TaxID=285679 RepID=UPI00224FDA44|nr:hypothetical protein [Micromonospora lupini]MCX5070172.1 DUF916 domain-containing protein [Micromonospora lupini]